MSTTRKNIYYIEYFPAATQQADVINKKKRSALQYTNENVFLSIVFDFANKNRSRLVVRNRSFSFGVGHFYHLTLLIFFFFCPKQLDRAKKYYSTISLQLIISVCSSSTVSSYNWYVRVCVCCFVLQLLTVCVCVCCFVLHLTPIYLYGVF